MKHRVIILITSIAIIAAVAGGIIYWQWSSWKMPSSLSRDQELGIYLSRTRLLISFKSGTAPSQITSIIESFGGHIVESMRELKELGIFVVDIPDSGTLDNIKRVAAELRKNPRVQSVSIDTPLSPLSPPR